MSSQISVHLNGVARSVDADATLAAVLADAGIDETRRGVAVAVGDEVVRRADWPTRQLTEGDRIEVVTATQGG